MLKKIQTLLDKLSPVPPDWYSSNGKHISNGHSPTYQVDNGVECTSYDDLRNVWEQALHWTDNIDVSFSTMFSVVTSTMLLGDQIWLRVIGPPGSVKTTLCEAIGTNREYCHNWGKFTGIHSGDNKVPEHEKPAAKIINKTNLVNEGDVIVSASPEMQMKIMTDLRDIYSGILRSQYLNGEGQDLTGVRSTWTICGTPSLRRLNRSQLGDRFLDVVIYKTSKGGAETTEETNLLKKVAQAARKRCRQESGEDADSKDSPERTLAYHKTAGFVKYLREVAVKQTSNIDDRMTNKQEEQCIKLAQLVAFMRARPDSKAESEDIEPELATRLTSQFLRLAICLAATLGKDAIDDEVMRRVAKVAEDTCFGSTFTLAKVLYNAGKPLTLEQLFGRTDYKLETVKHAKNVLFALGCIRGDNSNSATPAGVRGRTTGLWRLSPQMQMLMKNLSGTISVT